MSLRRQLPYSPLAAGALRAGARAGAGRAVSLPWTSSLSCCAGATRWSTSPCAAAAPRRCSSPSPVRRRGRRTRLSHCPPTAATTWPRRWWRRAADLPLRLDPHTLAPDLAVRARARGRVGTLVAAPLYGIPIPWKPLKKGADPGARGHNGRERGPGTRRVVEWTCRGIAGEHQYPELRPGKGWTGGPLGRCSRATARTRRHRTRSPVRPVPVVGTLAQWLLRRPGIYGLPASIP
jgi:hypothetical protein